MLSGGVVMFYVVIEYFYFIGIKEVDGVEDVI